jgi:VanZ like protein
VKTNRVGTVLAVVVFGLICLATLTPSPGTQVTADLWCIACGELGALDVLANVVMFVPFGFALLLATNRPWLSIAACVATTVIVESLQIRVIVGRDASLSDVLANSLGGLIGVEIALRRRLILLPRPRTALRLALSWCGVFAAVCALAAAGLRPPDVPRSLWVQWTPPRPSFEPFSGHVFSFELDSIDLPLGYPSPSFGVDRVLRGPEWTARARVTTQSLQRRRSVITRIADEYTVQLSIEQLDADLGCVQKTRAADFRFRSPKVAVRGAFTPTNREPPGIVTLSCARASGRLIAGIDGEREVVRLSPSLGWLLLSPFDVAVTNGSDWVNALWLLTLMLPAGYWAGMTQTRSRSARRRLALASAGGVAAVALGLNVAPALAGVAAGVEWEWGAALTGAVIGFGVALVARRVWRARELDQSH